MFIYLFLFVDFFFFFFFFFSSRRRHTRCGRDRSSDVCSSDLPRRDRDREGHRGVARVEGQVVLARRVRSEERRVGKECRSRWWPNNKKKKRNMKSRNYVAELGATLTESWVYIRTSH